MRLDPEKPFFDFLKEGVEYIETTVRSLKQESENGFPSLNEPFSEEELTRLVQFDEGVKNTFADVSQLFNQVMQKPFNLNDLAKTVDDLKHQLIQYENNSGFKEFGYKPFIYPNTPEKKNLSPSQLVNGDETGGNLSATVEANGKPSLANLLKDKENDKSRLLRSTFKVAGRKSVESKRRSIIEATKIPANHKNLGYSPNKSVQETKKYPVMMPPPLLNSPNDKEDSRDGISIKYITGCKMANSLVSADSTVSSFTHSVSESALSKYETSEVLVEFTPGLTTTRPATRTRGRIDGPNNIRAPLDYRPGKFGSPRSSNEEPRYDVTPTVNRTFLKKYRSTTPESPTLSWSTAANKIQNSHNTYRINPESRANLRSLEKSTPEEPKTSITITAIKKTKNGTPDMPTCNIDLAFHQRLLAKSKTLRDDVM